MECPSCRAANPPEARFCNQCGARLEGAREAEHRQLTVLFADLVGSTQLAARLGAEDWRDTVRRFQRAAGECVAQAEGTIAQYLGDGVLVYFGHPAAHEDDPERALGAGLALLARVEALNQELEREYGVRIAARLAAHTGPVVIGEMGGQLRTEQLALGEAPNVAARLQELAPPGSLVTSAATRALVGTRFDLEELGVHALKGVREPMAVYRVAREAQSRSRFRGGVGAALSPLVGRARELEALRGAFEAAAWGRGGLVWITGEPGIGKSRLLHELQRELDGTAHRWLDLHPSPYAQQSAFEPFRALLAREHAPSLEAGAASQLPERRRAATIAALGDWVLELAADRPVVLAVEDLHALDPSTVEALERIVERVENARALVAVTARSGTKLPDGWVELATRIELGALTPLEVASLVASAAAAGPLPDDLRARIAERSDGNPLFAEELARSPAADVPASLRDPLRARLDRTGPAQATAQLASALGREFDYALLRAVSPLDEAELASQLGALVDANLIVERGSGGGASYQFRHALLRDAAYDSMLRRTRRSRHADIARALKESFGATARARPELVAHHLAAAGDHERAAVEWLRAAKRASDTGAFREALLLVDQGLASLAQAPQEKRAAREAALHIYRAHAYGHLRGPADRDALASYQRARELAEAIDDPGAACMALLGVHGSVMLTGSTRDATEIADELLERARQSGQLALQKSASLAAGMTAFARGEWPRAHQHLFDALGLGVLWTAESYLLRTTWMCGQLEAALRMCDEYAERVRSESPVVRDEMLCGFAGLHLLTGDFERALACALESVAITRQDGQELPLARALCYEGAARIGLGEVAAGIEKLEAGYAMVDGTPSASFLAWFAPFRADAWLAAGDVARAIALADEGLADEAARDRHVCQPELLRVKGEACARVPGRADEARATLLEAIQVARRQGARGWEQRAARSLTQLDATRSR